jgi:hypothetical protein
MVLSELILHGRYQSFVVCKMGDCYWGETGNSGKKRALLAYSSGKISSTQPAVNVPSHRDGLENLHTQGPESPCGPHKSLGGGVTARKLVSGSVDVGPGSWADSCAANGNPASLRQLIRLISSVSR